MSENYKFYHPNNAKASKLWKDARRNLNTTLRDWIQLRKSNAYRELLQAVDPEDYHEVQILKIRVNLIIRNLIRLFYAPHTKIIKHTITLFKRILD